MTFDNDPWRAGYLDSKDPASRSITSPRVVPDPVSGPKWLSVFWGIVGIALLGVVEGTLVWLALVWATRLGWLSETPDWWPVTAIVVALTFVRAFDRSVFRR